jgi:hypothetical protein
MMGRHYWSSVLALYIICALHCIHATQYTIYNAPTISNSHSVQFFYLEAPFPFNAPSDIV